MDHDERLHIHLELCRRIFNRMRRDGSWPWAKEDSTNSEDLVDSESFKEDV